MTQGPRGTILLYLVRLQRSRVVVPRIQRGFCHPGKRIMPAAISHASRDDYDAFDRPRIAPEWRTGRESAPSSTWNISHCDRLLLNRSGQTIGMKRMTKAAIAIVILLMCGAVLTNAQVSSGQRQGQGSGTEQSNNSGGRGTPATGNTGK
jgi:hypothetical protein